MERIDQLRLQVDKLRPLSNEQIQQLWPMWDKEDALYVYTSNAIEGNSLTLGETTVVLENGVTIGGKSLKEHLEVINGAKAYHLMLDMAKAKRPITANALLAIHEVVVAGEEFAGAYRDHAVYIRGSQHVPANSTKVKDLIAEMFETYEEDCSNRHPVVAGARLHFNIAHIHPFADGNGRTARLLNNLHLISHGYPPVIITPDRDKPAYFAALESSHMGGEPGKGDPTEFSSYMIGLEEQALERYMKALHISHGHSPDQRGGGR